MAGAQRLKNELSRCCSQAMGACYQATLRSAKAMLGNKDVLEAYLEARSQEANTIDVTTGVATVGLLSSAAMTFNTVSAPWSFSAFGAWLATGIWPEVLIVTNPAGLVVGVVGLAILAASLFKKSQMKQDILRHQKRKSILIITAHRAVYSLWDSCSDSTDL